MDSPPAVYLLAADAPRLQAFAAQLRTHLAQGLQLHCVGDAADAARLAARPHALYLLLGLPLRPGAAADDAARDLALLSRYIIQTFPEFYPLFSEPEFTWNKIRQLNRNSLLELGVGVDGLKTGHTEASGYGEVISAPNDGRRLIAVLHGDRELFGAGVEAAETEAEFPDQKRLRPVDQPRHAHAGPAAGGGVEARGARGVAIRSAGLRLVVGSGRRSLLQRDRGDRAGGQPFRLERLQYEQKRDRNRYRLCKNQPQPAHERPCR